jgi:GNAT superfamily N-acetyltransferase
MAANSLFAANAHRSGESMQITAISLDDRAGLKRFIEYPYQKYKNHPVWVPPLLVSEWELVDRKKNPYLHHCALQLFLALDGQQVVGRVAAVDDQNYNGFHGQKTALFANFEAKNATVATALMQAVEAWAKSRGLNTVRGPGKLEQNDMMGLLVENFDDPPAVMMVYNPPEYAGFMLEAGYIKCQDTFAWNIFTEKGLSERTLRVAERVRRNLPGLVIRPINLKQLDQEVATIRDIYNAAWQHNWGFVPWTEAEIDHMKGSLKQVADTQATVIAEMNGQAVAFTLVVPDINESLRGTGGRLFPLGLLKLLLHKPKRARMLAMGVRPEYQGKGIDALLYADVFSRRGRSYSAGEMGWTLESNEAVNKAITAIGGTPYKRYRIFEKKLSDGLGLSKQ